jgi:predicted metal-dependent phosphoesterase TrpH
MPSQVDLHTHTTASDGTVAPEVLLAEAAGIKVRYLAITDHDSTQGYESLMPLFGKFPEIKILPAIEINTLDEERSCHILGYLIDPTNAAFQNKLLDYRRRRLNRIERMLPLFEKMGIAISLQEIMDATKGGSVGRPHVADVLKKKGIVRSRHEAFDRFLKTGAPAYVKPESPTANEAINIIRQAGGVPVLAHPRYEDSDALMKELKAAGLMGIEAYYPEHSRSLTRRYVELAHDLGLICTGGSDYHGPASGRERLAIVDVPETVIEGIYEARNQL